MIKRVLCFSNPARLHLRLEQLVINTPDPNAGKNNYDIETTIPIEDIGVVVLDNKQVCITQALMAKLLENNTAVITCDDHHLPIGLMLPLDGHNLQSERFREQICASEPLRKQMWQQTVQQKIKNQAAVLAFTGVEARNMLAWSQKVKSGDTDNIEGRAAVYYWKNLFPKLPNFIRAQDGLPPNQLLNYGYAIVRALVARALVAYGLLPTFGIHHHNRYNAYCLADDIMEPYRPYVDEEILLIVKTYADYSELNYELKKKLLSITVKEVIIDGHRSPMMLAIMQTALSVEKCFCGEARKILYPEM